MGRLVFSGIMSLDGYVVDADGRFDWSMPDEEVHAFVNDLARPLGTFLYGRRLYDVMVAWEDPGLVAGEPAPMQDFAEIWRAADKVVYSTTLTTPRSARTRVEPLFDAEAVRRLKATADRDIGIGGPTLAAHAIRAGLVDEYQMVLSPAVVGGGTRFLPDDVRLDLELLEERRFAGGAVFLRYRPRT